MSQTVNVCTASNEVGNYETKYRLPAAVTVSVEVLNELADLEALGAWVLAHEGEAENVGSGPGRAVLPLVPGSVDDEQWLERAQAATEQVLAVWTSLALAGSTPRSSSRSDLTMG